MSRLFKAYPSAFVGSRDHYSTLEKEEVATYSADWNGIANDLGTTVSTSAWSESASAITTASAALTSGVATLVVTAAEAGDALLINKATMANGAVREQRFYITVLDTQ